MSLTTDDKTRDKSRDVSPSFSSESNLKIRDLIRKRGIIKGRLTKFTNYLQLLENSSLESTSQSRIDLKLRMNGATTLFSEFNEIQTKIEENVSDGELFDQLNQREVFEDSYYSTMAHAESMLDSEATDGSRNQSCHSHNTQIYKSIKLPTIVMPTFDGSFEHWLEFRDTFISLVHDSNEISNIQKFHYLKSSLKGSAKLVIDSIEFSANNYLVAWELLVNRYNNSRLLVQNHVKALFTISPLTKESPSHLRNLIDMISKNLRSLNILGEPTDTWDTLIIYIVVSKLDKTTEREWETHKSTLFSRDNNSHLKLSDLIQFLRGRADMLETLQLSHRYGLSNEVKKQYPSSKTHFTSHCNVSTGKPSERQFRNHVLCLKCNAKHSLYSCQKFIESDLESKLKFVREQNLCANCLRSGHTIETCKFGTCRKCNLKHNSLLHNDNANTIAYSSLTAHTLTKSERSGASPSASSAASSPATACSSDILPIQVNKAHMQKRCVTAVGIESVLLSTAIVEVADSQGIYHKVCALLDSGSQRCFITESLCQLLKTTLIQSTNKIKGIGNSVINCSQTCNIIMKSCVDNTYIKIIKCFVLKEITSNISTVCQLNAKLCIPNNIQLADPQFLESKQIDILIGADIFWDLLGEGKIRLSVGPYLQNTKLGWIVSGPILNTRYSTQIQCNFSNSLESQLKMFWELEEVPKVRDAQTEEERACEDHFNRNTTRNSDGRFCVRIPLKQSPDVLGDTYFQAERQFFTLERRLQRSPDYKLLYANFMQEYLDLGHMSKVDIDYSHPCYFMPHHGVFREHSTTTKLRVVFNASAISSTGKSLNDLQLVGPPIQGDLIAILLRFRQHKFVVCADIEKMYRQCLVDKSQRNLQLILWRDDPSKPIGIYQLNTVTYGTASAPFLSVRCLKQLAIESSDPDVQRVIQEDFYVDDYISGLDDKTQLLELCSKLKNTLQSGCLPLRKWIFNFKCDTDKIMSDQSKELTLNDNISSKTLGICWNNLSDQFYFNTHCRNDNTPVTKRIILSSVSQIFDPLGLLSPIIIVAKVLLQQLWLLKLGWDDSVPFDVARTWNQFVTSLCNLNNIRIPRHAVGSDPRYTELHIFTDASQTAYGACIYIRSVNNDRTVLVRLLISKAKVAPLKPISVPRLELSGALLGARLYDKVRSSLRQEFARIVFWTDSTIVLGWLKMSPNRLKPFVQNRTAEIQELTQDIPWYHVNSKENPADIASRGASLNDLSSSSLWWNGPEFLRNSNFSLDDFRNKDISLVYPDEQLPEIKSTVTALTCNESCVESLFPFTRFSKFNRMKRTMAFILRFIHNNRNKLNKRVGVLSVDELDNAQIVLAKLSQIESYPIEYNLLLKNKSMKSKSNLSKLNIFFDQNKIIRVGGRLGYSDEFDFNKKHPILLSSKHQFTYLLFRHTHTQLLHAGPQALLFHLRESWWPVSGRSLARQTVRQCVMCTRLKGKTLTPLMGNLPKERITPGYPFIRCGVDYAGPVLTLNRKGRGAKTIKTYICLFICFVTRAVHLELVSDLSSQAYLLALKRFYISPRKTIRNIFRQRSEFCWSHERFFKFFTKMQFRYFRIRN